MNLLKLVTLNKHANFEEVLFTSILSYLLNPKFKLDHGLNDKFLNKILVDLIPDYKPSSPVTVSSEKNLGNAGNIDLYVETAEYIIGIEAKIWDRSANNVSADGVPQLERYCAYIDKKAKEENKKWFLIFLIPNEISPKCLEEYNRVKAENVKLMTWIISDDEKISKDFLSKSISNIIDEINREEKEMKFETKWILDSLLEVIPDLNDQIKDNQRFPSKGDLTKLTKTWQIFESFFQCANRWPNPLSTTVGIPYGYLENKRKLYGNSLYRIRTTKKYYTEISEKENNLPSDYIEIELWPDVYEQVAEKITSWMNKNHITIKDGQHLDEQLKTNVKILTINSTLNIESVKEFNTILREGYNLVEKINR
jgi:hypothetical protein